MTTQGVVKWYSVAKGYGFIVRGDDAQELFVHHTAIAGGGNNLREGDRVRFEAVETARGLQAQNVERLSG